MNSPVLKLLSGAALIMVILASGAVILHNIAAPNPTSPPNPGTGNGSGSSDGKTDPSVPQVVSTSPPPVMIHGPAVIPPDHPLQPSYKPINQPTYLQFLKQEGKTYHTKVVGKIAGQASKKDWGVRGTAFFEYIYAVESTGKIIRSDGTKVVEERTFGKVHENLLVSAYEIRIELPEKLDTVFEILGYFGGQIGDLSSKGRAVGQIVNNVRVPVKKEWIDRARESGMFSKIPQLDPRQLESELKMFSQGTDNRLLEGKTVHIVFIDGSGVQSVEGIGCEISEQERDIVVRTNFVMDHYLFPDHKVEPGADWEVTGDVFSGFLDPRLRGKVGGTVTVLRTPDFIDAQAEVSKRLRIVKGEMVVRKESGQHEITGQITGLKGICVIPDKLGVVTSGHLQGYVDYKNLTRDHLLFSAETTFTPRIDISYECSVE